MKHHSIFRAFATVFFTVCLVSFLQAQTCDQIKVTRGTITWMGNVDGVYKRLPLPASDPNINTFDPACNCWSNETAGLSFARLTNGSWYMFKNKTCNTTNTIVAPFVNALTSGCDPTTLTGIKWACGDALDFDGKDDAVVVSHNASLNITGDITFETWAYIRPSLIGPTVSQSILDKTEKTDLANYRFFIQSNNKMGFFTDNNSVKVFSATPVPTGQWVHLAWVLKSGTMTFYTNGIPNGTAVASIGKVNNGPLTIGRDNNQMGLSGEGQRPINMKLDELRIWTRALSKEEILNNMNCELSGSEPNLLAYYQVMQGDALPTTLIEFNNKYNGTLTNFALNGATSNWLKSGGVVMYGAKCR